MRCQTHCVSRCLISRRLKPHEQGMEVRFISDWPRPTRSARGRMRAACDQADSRNIKNRFRNSIYPQVPLDQRVLECGCAEGSQSQPRCREAKRLTKMAGLEQNDSICPSSTVLPHGPREDRCHDEKSCRLRKIRLIRAIRTCHARTYFGRESCQAVILGLVVIDSSVEPLP